MTKRKSELVDVTELVLAPTPAEGKVRKKRKPLTLQQRLESPALGMRLLGHYHVTWWFKFRFPMSEHAERRDIGILKNLGDDWGEDAVCDTIDAFFASTDPRITRAWSNNYNVPDFLRLSAYVRRAQQPGGDISDKTAGNIHEISKAMGRSSSKP